MDIKIDGLMYSLQTASTSDSDIYTPIPPKLVAIITKWVSSTPDPLKCKKNIVAAMKKLKQFQIQKNHTINAVSF